MKVHFLFLLLVYKTTKCDNIVKSQTIIVSNFDEKCKNIKCSAQDDPTCVKIKHLQDMKRVFHVLAANKCELQFMKCHKDYEANIVAMKLCEHKNITKREKEHSSSMTRRVRNKRSIFRGDTKFPLKGIHVLDSMSSEDEPGHKIHTSDIYDDKGSNKQPKKRLLSRNQDSKKSKGLTQNDNSDRRLRIQKLKKKITELQRRKRNMYKKKNPKKEEDGRHNDEEEAIKDGLSMEEKDKISALKLYITNKEALKLAESTEEEDKSSVSEEKEVQIPESEVKEVQNSGELLPQETAPSGFQLFSEENIGERNNNEANAVPPNDDACPDSCPAHANMICVQCAHDVYKTFLSTCHLRQYCCLNEDESDQRRHQGDKQIDLYENGNYARTTNSSTKLDFCKGMQLVSREPCILSAPYILADNLGETSHGKVENQHNNDIVVDYLKCKSLGILGRSDPRCLY